MKRTLSIAAILLLGFLLVIHTGPKVTHAQFGPAQVPGFFAPGVNAVINAAIGSSGAVTNPAVNFIVLIQGGSVYCNASVQTIAQSTITLVANTTYQIEYNCLTAGTYAKTGVTGPGTLSPNQPGVPTTLLFPIPGVEIPLATVVCGATACGNTNGSITDARPVAQFPGSGLPLNTTTFTNLPTTNVTDGTMILCSSCTQPTAGSATCTTGAANVLAVRVAATWRCY